MTAVRDESPRVLPRDHARAAYDALAPGYDTLTSGHDHHGWTGLLERLAREVGLTGRRLLDVGCGTGNSLLPMLERGYAVTGVDLSPAMLAEAECKTEGRARLLEGDIRELDALGEFDLVLCLGDALNYLQTQEELIAALAGLRRNLAAGGIAVFDVNTLATFRALYSSLLVIPAHDRVVVVEGRSSSDLPDGGAAMTWIDRLERQESGWWRRVRSVHHHRHHPERAVRAALSAAGLECCSAHGTRIDGSLHTPLDELAHDKAVYTARRRAP
jgi:SAM-dependent methyltransferase